MQLQLVRSDQLLAFRGITLHASIDRVDAGLIAILDRVARIDHGHQLQLEGPVHLLASLQVSKTSSFAKSMPQTSGSTQYSVILSRRLAPGLFCLGLFSSN